MNKSLIEKVTDLIEIAVDNKETDFEKNLINKILKEVNLHKYIHPNLEWNELWNSEVNIWD